MATFGTAQSENRNEVCLGHFDAKHKDNQLVLYQRLWNTSEDISSEQVVPACKLYHYTMKDRLPDKKLAAFWGLSNHCC